MSRILALLLVFLASAATLVSGALWFSHTEALHTAMGMASAIPMSAFATVHKPERDIAVAASKDGVEEADTVPIIRYATIADHMPDEGKFIAVDLLAHQILTFKDGRPVATYPIVKMPATSTSVGEASRVASELAPRTGVLHKDSDLVLPIGVGEVTAIKDTLLGDGGTILPWNTELGGRCLVHGIPYTRNFAKSIIGEDAPKQECLLLSDVHARALFSFAEVHTPFYVYDGTEQVVIHIERLTVRDVPLPHLDAKAFIMVDVVTGDVYADRRADTRLPIASVTKLMTALVSRDVLKAGQVVRVSERGTSYAAGDLLYPLFLRSDNAVAEALAVAYGRRIFIERMNMKAHLLGMEDTTFEDASGISANNRSTVTDLARLTRYLFEHDKELLEVSAAPRAHITSTTGIRWAMASQNRFAVDDSFLGGKLGFTESARQTGLSLFRVRVDGSVRTVGIVVLGSEDWKSDTRTLLSWFARSAKPRSGTLVASDRERASQDANFFVFPATPANMP